MTAFEATIGFTGTQTGLTRAQEEQLTIQLAAVAPCEFHHGLRVGADHLAHLIAVKLGCRIIGHPPVDDILMMPFDPQSFAEMRSPQPYLRRNKQIVRSVARIFACPKGPEEVRSGTWSTVRFARRSGVPVTVFWPDGRVQDQHHV